MYDAEYGTDRKQWDTAAQLLGYGAPSPLISGDA